MKSYKFIFCLMLTLVSCQTMTFEDIEGSDGDTPKGSKTMHFRLTGFSMNNIDEMRTDDYDDTRSSTVPQGATDNLILGIFTTEGQLIDTLHHQHKDDTGIKYGTFSHTQESVRYPTFIECYAVQAMNMTVLRAIPSQCQYGIFAIFQCM